MFKKVVHICLFLQVFSVFSQDIDIPDKNFLNALLIAGTEESDDTLLGNTIIDKNGDGKIQEEEALKILKLTVSGKHIKSLQGIAHFKHLMYLNVAINDLTTIDLSKNKYLEILDVRGNDLKELQLEKLSNLYWLSCSFNNLQELNFSKNLNLKILDCKLNSIKRLDLSMLTKVHTIYCGYNNDLEYLNLLNNKNLSTLRVEGTEKLQCILVEDGLELSNFQKDEHQILGRTCN
ncbi:hypothetical protein GCM10011344_46260 [Dokdonia pacifica]|uniref:EF-hand domain-containing protein n=1 Tax=Dokdonia pacifica TaxID=1627892 RepID=A0A239DAR6_9FLAO|nr:hypothetical protein [Dokdonia pacifica]GGG40155.1 hypothetical protein GCM10011344_46260 [Dokdonia pacifica]SNS29435.1 hypothetical protein SAMN06265376_11076 [Dokdonia pacifica]